MIREEMWTYPYFEMEVVDLDGDEDDGKDEAFVLLDSFGNGSESTYLVDDEFSKLLVLLGYAPRGFERCTLTDS